MQNKKILIVFCIIFFLNFNLLSNKKFISKRLKQIKQLINTSIFEWDYSTNRSKWRKYTLGNGIAKNNIRFKTIVKVFDILGGTIINGNPLFLNLHFHSRGFSEIKITLNNQLIGVFSIEGPPGTGCKAQKTFLITKASFPRKYKLEVQVKNKGFRPFRKTFWPPRKSKLKEAGIKFKIIKAELFSPGAAPIQEKVRNWLLSMQIAFNLLYPDFSHIKNKDKFSRFEEKVNKQKKIIEQLKQILWKSVRAFDINALHKGNKQKINHSIQISYSLSHKIRKFAKEIEIYLVGNSHIDIAWLWRKNETIQVAKNTFTAVLDNMIEYPELHYAQSQALIYEWIEKKYPNLFKQIRKKVYEGKWEIVGGMWVEPDCNLISGESLVRQLLYGKKYFREKFNKDVNIGWNLDSFGFNGNLPQIFKKSGIDYFITTKMWWNDTTEFPYYMFWWKGVDQTKLLSYFPPLGYTSEVKIFNVLKNISLYEAVTDYKSSMILYGIGNHGGGPNREILQRIREYNQLFISPKLIHTRAHDFLQNISSKLKNSIPTWDNELYLEYHRGTYTSQTKMKKYNRKLESLISSVEKMAVIANLLEKPYPKKDLEKAWKIILTNQFHDILPGSSITPVYQDALEDYTKALHIIENVQSEVIEKICHQIDTSNIQEVPVVIFNSLSWNRSGPVSFNSPLPAHQNLSIIDNKGEKIPIEIKQNSQNGRIIITFVARDIPALGYRLFTLKRENSFHKSMKTTTNGKRLVIENKFFRVSINKKSGNMMQIYDKQLNKEFVEPGKEANVLQIYEDKPEDWDAWNIGYTGRMWELNKAEEVKIENVSPVRVVVKVKKNFLGLSKQHRSPTEDFPSSFFTQYIILYNNIDRIDIVTEADWWEDHMFLKVAFPVSIKSDQAVFEIPFATIKRSTRRKTLWEKARFEVPALKWADLSGKKFGISLLNKNKHGYDIHSNIMKLSLLRSPTWPDPLTDRGKHKFVYSIYTHAGDWTDGETVKRGYELNVPLKAIITEKKDGILPAEFSFFRVNSSGVILDSMKKAEKGAGIIVRLYESKGKDEHINIKFLKKAKKVYETDLMENHIKLLSLNTNQISLNLKKFEIKSIKIEFDPN